MGDRYLQAEVLGHLAAALADTGDVDQARAVRHRAAEILEQLGHPEAAELLM